MQGPPVRLVRRVPGDCRCEHLVLLRLVVLPLRHLLHRWRLACQGRELRESDLRLLHRTRAEPEDRHLRFEAILRAAAGSDRLGCIEFRHDGQAVPEHRQSQRQYGFGQPVPGHVCLGLALPGAGHPVNHGHHHRWLRLHARFRRPRLGALHLFHAGSVLGGPRPEPLPLVPRRPGPLRHRRLRHLPGLELGEGPVPSRPFPSQGQRLEGFGGEKLPDRAHIFVACLRLVGLGPKDKLHRGLADGLDVEHNHWLPGHKQGIDSAILLPHLFCHPADPQGGEG
mmetsp:Transcript_35172/g.101047  ORF Transcript_35172/g.101047 Transcript_35172/m.101047 type:complete len:282 (+) Transcript_35172:563-1408(+)